MKLPKPAPYATRVAVSARMCGYRDSPSMVNHLMRCGWSKGMIAHAMGVPTSVVYGMFSTRKRRNFSRVQLMALARVLAKGGI